MRPTIALIGRPNVGKSTLYNYLTESRDALVADYAGLTRDRKYGVCRRYGADFIVVDTGGVLRNKERLTAEVFDQTRLAVEEADVVLFLVDANEGLNSDDEFIAQWLRKNAIDFVLVVNKVDGTDENIATSDFYRLGARKVFPIAAKRGRGVRSMLVELGVCNTQPNPSAAESAENEPTWPTVAIVGRPNVGKSTLTNALLKSERMIVSDVSGTTRDAVSVICQINRTPYRLIDTAGIRRKSKTHELIEKFSIVQALQAIEDAHVVVLLIDATQGVTDQDSTLTEIVLREGRALVFAVNKSDIATDEDRKRLEYTFDTRLQFAAFVERVPVSAKKRVGLRKLMNAVERAYRSAAVSMSTPDVNKYLEAALAAHQPPMNRGRRIKIRYAHQAGIHPPTLVLHGTQTDQLPMSYVRYLENYFRKTLRLVGTPIRFHLRKGSNPYEGKRNKLTPRQQRKRERMLKRRGKS